MPPNRPTSATLPAPYQLAQLGSEQAAALMRYYNGLSVESKRTFRPLGTETDLTTARAICRANHDERPERYDLVVMHGDEIAGWCFVWDLDKKSPQLGLGIADAHQQRGLGRCLITALLDWARRQALTRIGLIAVEDNVAALRLYESCGFRITGRRHDERDGLDYHEMTVDLTNKPEET